MLRVCQKTSIWNSAATGTGKQSAMQIRLAHKSSRGCTIGWQNLILCFLCCWLISIHLYPAPSLPLGCSRRAVNLRKGLRTYLILNSLSRIASRLLQLWLQRVNRPEVFRAVKANAQLRPALGCNRENEIQRLSFSRHSLKPRHLPRLSRSFLSYAAL